MTRFQKTLKAPVTITGVGLHFGKSIVMTVHPAKENSGITFVRTDTDPRVTIPVEPLRVNDTRMATTVNEGKVFVSTIEHLMSAFCGLGVDNALIEINASETPIKDGSALDYISAIESVGTQEQSAQRRFVRVKSVIEVRDGDKWAKLTPADGFEMEFAIDFKHPVIDKTVQRTALEVTEESYKKEIAYARTFGFMKDFEMLKKMGLAQGGSLANAVVVDDEEILNPEGLRADDEFLKHKMLDAVGDLYVLGHPLKARYSAFKSGHGLNNQLLRALLNHPEAWDYV